MDYRILDKNSKEEVASLFASAFSSSEGKKEGELISNLASRLSSRADNQEIICIGAYEEGSIIGVIFFTRLRFIEPVTVYMLAPVAVSPKHQGKGVGQALIKYGLNELKNRAVAVAITYGWSILLLQGRISTSFRKHHQGSGETFNARGLARPVFKGRPNSDNQWPSYVC